MREANGSLAHSEPHPELIVKINQQMKAKETFLVDSEFRLCWFDV